MKQTKGIYQSADGKLWRDAKKCKQHDAWLELVELSETLDDFIVEGDQAETLAEALANHSIALIRILRANPLKDGGELPVDEGADE